MEKAEEKNKNYEFYLHADLSKYEGKWIAIVDGKAHLGEQTMHFFNWTSFGTEAYDSNNPPPKEDIYFISDTTDPLNPDTDSDSATDGQELTGYELTWMETSDDNTIQHGPEIHHSNPTDPHYILS